MSRRISSQRNPYNQPEPAEWATMSPKLKKRWRKAHWRPNEWMVVVPLKRFATRKANQRTGGQRGEGMNSLAEKLEKARTNPMNRSKTRTTRSTRRSNPSSARERAADRAADRAERKRLRAERKRVWREENVRPLRENPKRRGRRNPAWVPVKIMDVHTRAARGYAGGWYEAIAETSKGMVYGGARENRATARRAVRSLVAKMDADLKRHKLTGRFLVNDSRGYSLDADDVRQHQARAHHR